MAVLRCASFFSDPASSECHRQPTGTLRKKLLIGAACVLPLMGGTALAQDVTISDARTAPVDTATANSGSAANVTIDGNGSVTVASGTAVTQNSDNNLTMDGNIVINPSDDSIGILVDGNITGDLSIGGDIELERSQAQEDANDGMAVPDYNDNRSGVLLGAGSSLTGNITVADTSTITVFGDQSIGMNLAGDVTGNIDLAGDIVIDGEDARALNISGNITGDVTTQSDSVFSVTGVNASGIVIDGNIDGAAILGGNITLTAYRDLVPDADDDADNDNAAQAALQAGPALSVSGDITGGLLLAGPLPPEEVDDGDTAIARSVISVLGGSNALHINGSTLGLVDTSDLSAAYGDWGLINRASLSSTGTYEGVDTEAARIENATIAGGFRNDGTITATATNAHARGLVFGSGADIQTFYNDGSVNAVNTGADDFDVTGLLIESGANVTTITNAGIIFAGNVNDAGDAIAVQDASGLVSTVTNSGLVQGRVTDFANEGDAVAPTGSAIAYDFSANTLGVSITNTVSADFDADTDNRLSFGIVSGDVLLGSGDDFYRSDAGNTDGDLFLAAGNDTVEIAQNSTLTGNVDFAAGDDTLTLDAAFHNGNVDFGAGADVFSLSNAAEFDGMITDADGALTLTATTGSQLILQQTGTLNVTDLSLDGTSTLGILVEVQDDDTIELTNIAASGTATLADGARINTRLSGGVVDNFSATIVTAGTLNADETAIQLGDEDGNTPFLFDFALTRSGNDLILNVDRKAATELGIAAALDPAINPTIEALNNDPSLGDFVFNLTSGDEFRAAFGQLLSGPLDAPLTYARSQNNSVTSIITQRLDLARNSGEFGRTFWLQEETYFVNRDSDETSNGFDGGGWSLAAGIDTGAGPVFDAVGVSASFSSARYDEQTGEDFPFRRLTYGGDIYAASSFGKFQVDGRVGYSIVSSDSERNVVLGNERRVIEGEWDGTQTAASGRISYETDVSGYTLEPFLSVDYLTITEDEYEETGGSTENGVKLRVEERDATSLRTNLGVKAGKVFELRPSAFDTGIPGTVHPQFTLAWSQELEDDPIETTYQYLSGGDAFTLASDPEEGAAIIGADIAYENEYAKIHIGASGTFGELTEAYVLRVGVGLKW